VRRSDRRAVERRSWNQNPNEFRHRVADTLARRRPGPRQGWAWSRRRLASATRRWLRGFPCGPACWARKCPAPWPTAIIGDHSHTIPVPC